MEPQMSVQLVGIRRTDRIYGIVPLPVPEANCRSAAYGMAIATEPNQASVPVVGMARRFCDGGRVVSFMEPV